jgi:DNA-binding transcriptional regulator YiaG
MARRIDLRKVVEIRRHACLNQSAFWSRFGVTQSGGSRYESGRSMPRPTSMLVWLRESGVITDNDLDAAKKAVSRR